MSKYLNAALLLSLTLATNANTSPTMDADAAPQRTCPSPRSAEFARMSNSKSEPVYEWVDPKTKITWTVRETHPTEIMSVHTLINEEVDRTVNPPILTGVYTMTKMNLHTCLWERFIDADFAMQTTLEDE